MAKDADSATLTASDSEQQRQQQDYPDASQVERQSLEKPTQEEQDGGMEAWLRVFGCHLVYLSTWGLLNAYGSYANYYKNELLVGYSASDIAWPGTLQAVLLISVGVLSGPLFDRGYVASLLIGGSFLCVFGVMMLSLAGSYYQIVLAQGICTGIGSGIIYVPSITLVAVSFKKHRAFAIAVATTGAAIGGLIFPIVLLRLLPVVGFAWATRILGFIALFCLTIGVGIMLHSRKDSPAPGPGRSLFEWSALAELPFLLFCLSLFFIFLAYLIPFFYMPSFVQVKLAGGFEWSIWSLVILNAATVPSRLLCPLLTGRLGATETLLLGAAINAVLLFCWFAVDTVPGNDVWTIVFGLASGPLVTIPAAVVPEISPNLNVVGTRMGMAWMFAAAGELVGAPVSGLLINYETKDFRSAQGLVDASMVVGGLCLVPALVRKTRSK